MNASLLWMVVLVLVTIPIAGRFAVWLRDVVFRKRHSTTNRVDWSDVTVRVLTVGEYAETVQETVNSLAETDADIQVVSEKPITIDGASVYVVGRSFTCEANQKGRALEWARRNLPKREYVLFLDEDSVLDSTERLPTGDIVQLRQNPVRTRSFLAQLAEFQRVGVSEEIYSFDPSDPDYIWGGGLMIAAEIEDQITWNRPSLQEDGAFIRNALDAGYKYKVAHKPQVINNAPPTFQAIVEQRRRWNSSEEPFITRLKREIGIRDGLVWMLNALFPVFIIVTILVNTQLLALLLPVYLINVIWTLSGVRHAGANLAYYPLAVFLAPITSLYNGLGNIYGLLDPATEFKVTDKQ